MQRPNPLQQADSTIQEIYPPHSRSDSEDTAPADLFSASYLQPRYRNRDSEGRGLESNQTDRLVSDESAAEQCPEADSSLEAVRAAVLLRAQLPVGQRDDREAMRATPILPDPVEQAEQRLIAALCETWRKLPRSP